MPEQAERIDLRKIPGMLKDHNGTAAVLRREGFENIFPHIADVDLVIRRFPPEEFSIGIPKDHTKGADQFAILGIAGRLDRAAALAAVEATFRPYEVARSEEPTSELQ